VYGLADAGPANASAAAHVAHVANVAHVTPSVTPTAAMRLTG
jgi:hypothetical protein